MAYSPVNGRIALRNDFVVTGWLEKRFLHFVQDDKTCGGGGGGIVLRTILVGWLLWSPRSQNRDWGHPVFWLGWRDLLRPVFEP